MPVPKSILEQFPNARLDSQSEFQTWDTLSTLMAQSKCVATIPAVCSDFTCAPGSIARVHIDLLDLVGSESDGTARANQSTDQPGQSDQPQQPGQSSQVITLVYETAEGCLTQIYWRPVLPISLGGRQIASMVPLVYGLNPKGKLDGFCEKKFEGFKVRMIHFGSWLLYIQFKGSWPYIRVSAFYVYLIPDSALEGMGYLNGHK